jgi:hypothetical protein
MTCVGGRAFTMVQNAVASKIQESTFVPDIFVSAREELDLGQHLEECDLVEVLRTTEES